MMKIISVLFLVVLFTFQCVKTQVFFGETSQENSEKFQSDEKEVNIQNILGLEDEENVFTRNNL